MSEVSRAVFIEQIASCVKKIAPGYGISVCSPIIAQACKESAFGTSELAIKANNFFGLKFKKGRCPGASLTPYNKEGSEQNPDGSYSSSAMQWFQFDSMESCVVGYFDFINVDRYKNLKGVTSPKTYCDLLKEDGYATSLTYATSLYNDYIVKYGLEKYDQEEKKMGYTNSPLVNYTQISPNKTVNRNHAIDTISIHCVVGQVTVERLGQIFAPTSKQASSNYGIGLDGRIGMYVEEKDRSWCTSSASNDNRAITIECASDSFAPYAVNDKVLASLIKLCADICKRNGIKQLLWKGDKSLIGQVDKQNMTVHRWFAAKSCPGDYLYNKHSYIASEVNKLLGAPSEEPAKTTDTYIYHTVAKGESLSRIASVYGVNYLDIAKLNNISNPSIIYVGQVLKIAVKANSVPTTYTVVKGDYLSKIAKNTGVSLDALKKLNPEVKAPFYIIRVGQVLRLK